MSAKDGSFEYQQHMLWLRNKKSNKRIKHSFPYITFAKPECDNVLQPEPRKNVISSLLYTFLSSTSSLNNFIQLYAEMSSVT